MDATTKPLRIPPEMSIYAETHEIFDLVQLMVTNLLVDKPEDPLQYLIDYLKRDSLEVPRVMLLGPPASGKRTIARQLCEQTRAVHVTASSVLKEDTELARRTQQHGDQKQEIPSEQWIRLIQQRLSKTDCVQQGWVLEGIPRNRQEALLLQELGIAPDHVVVLEAPDAVLIHRSLGKRVDPVTGDVYHTTFRWPRDDEVGRRLVRGEVLSEEQAAARLLRYHREAHGLRRAYENRLAVVNADQHHDDVYAQVLTHVLRRPRSAAPHTPRVLLLGPPASGKSLLAERIAQKYDIVNVGCGQLLKAAAADQAETGELITPYLETREPVPDSTVLQILTQRLSRLDCTTRGWVLHGFPRNAEQAKKLQESKFIPSRVFFLEVMDAVALERVALRAVDSVTGERYHSLYKPAPSPEVQARLRQSPLDSEALVQARLNEYWDHMPALQAVYPDAVYISGEQDPHTVLESLESRLVGQLPKRLSSPEQW
ncbi:adenylate kinase 8 isoform X1 [Anguilla anguilla]|uniref:adenylate kinase 8 isoform X1 n=1 Tax=Anguilla anguilla TaxID=7936 RepID=UPI0015A9F06D|nr:adenylate kinase 8 isoform X1 [Anguilla anguilla]